MYFKENFKETFVEMSQADILFPLLSDEQLKTMESRYTTLLNIVTACILEHGKDAVFIKSWINSNSP